MRLFSDSSGWDAMRRDLRFTAAALTVSDDHQPLAQALRGLLARWAEQDAQRHQVEDAVVDANARVATLDAMLDHAVTRLAVTVLAEVDGNRNSKLFGAFFPEAPSEIVRLGLENEIERTRAFFVVAEEHDASHAVQGVLADIRAIHTRGTEALAQREAATEAAARASLRRTTWREDANRARRSVENTLEQHAIDRNLGRDYATTFFASSGRTRPASETPGS